MAERGPEAVAPGFGAADRLAGSETSARPAGPAARPARPIVPSRAGLEWITIFGPAAYMALLSVVVLYFHPHPLPPFWPALAVAVGTSALGTYVFSRFVFAHVRRQEEEIVRRTRELAEVKEAMAVVKERQRIARELHDSLAQRLGYLHMNLARAEEQTTGPGQRKLRGQLTELKQVARAAYEEARQEIFGLRSMVARSLGLVPTLAEYLHDWSGRTGIRVELKADEALTLSPAVEVQVIRIIQEAMANVRKHAEARQVVVTLGCAAAVTTVSIRDDGRGFDVGAVPAEGNGGSFGLETMRERAESVGGTFGVASRPGEGTTVTIELPTGGPAATAP